MKIKHIRIENFRSFQYEDIPVDPYTCFVGPNGVGKSTVLAALNIFFQEKSGSSTDVAKLIDEDFYRKQTDKPVRITLTFTELSDAAKTELSDYVRNGELIVTAEATYDSAIASASVRHCGIRMGFESFKSYFDLEKSGAKAPELKAAYKDLQQANEGLPSATSKADQVSALHQYESERKEQCVPIESTDDFYGANSTGKLSKFVQWVYVPAVKDAVEEGLEAKNTALGKLIGRAVRQRTNFDQDLQALKTATLEKYQDLLNKNQESLSALSQSLQARLNSWAHSNAHLGITWKSDPEKSVSLQQPLAGIETGEGDFLGSLARMGHGLQRSYLLALLQELAGSDADGAPTLILGVEEPELYQHPPQARHLADVFKALAEKNNQVLVTTHSPYFLSGECFESTRIIKKGQNGEGSKCKYIAFEKLCERLKHANKEARQRKIQGMVAKLHQALQPHIGEMFFTRVPVLVEGLEDVAYITTAMHLYGKWDRFRTTGCHLIAVNGKDNLIFPLGIARELDIPAFTIFDSDSGCDEKYRGEHERDNRAIINLLGASCDVFLSSNHFAADCIVWAADIGSAVKQDFGAEYERILEKARVEFNQVGGLKKNELFIAEWLAVAAEEGLKSEMLNQVCEAILTHAEAHT